MIEDSSGEEWTEEQNDADTEEEEEEEDEELAELAELAAKEELEAKAKVNLRRQQNTVIARFLKAKPLKPLPDNV